MEVQIIAIVSALITGIFGPILTLFIQKKIKYSELPTSSKERLNKLKGKWYGYLIQEFEDKELKLDALAIFNNQGRIINGDVKMNDERGEHMHIVLHDGIFDGNIMKFNYRNKLSYIFQKGAIVGEMNPRGDEINGKFVGYSPSQKRIITGSFYLTEHPQ